MHHMLFFVLTCLHCFFLGAPGVQANTSGGNAVIFPHSQGVTLGTYGYDTKQDSRLGQLSVEYAQDLMQEEKFNSLRIPLRAAYYPDWDYDTCPWNGHPEVGVVNPEAYACSVNDITNAKVTNPNIMLFASLKMAYYDGTFYDYLPDRCYYHDEDIESGLWDGEKETRTKPAEYAHLIADFINYFSGLGITFDYLGIENESGYIPPTIFVEVMASLSDMASDGLFTWPAKGMVYPETYSPNSDWMRELAKLNGLQYLGASGIHYYGDEREHTDDSGRLTLREKLISWKGSVPEGTPKWHTEVHWAKATDFINLHRENATQMDSVENMVLQYVDYYQVGISAVYWWSYKKEGQSFGVTDNLQKNVFYHMTISTSGGTYLLTDDQDGKSADLYSFVTMGSRLGNTVTMWISNNKVGRAWDAYEVVIGGGTLATCSAQVYSAVSYMQYYETDELVTVSSGSRNKEDEDVELPEVELRYGEATITAANAFTLPIPAQTVTKITFEILDDVAPGTSTTTYVCHSDASVLEEDDPPANSEATVLQLNAKSGKASYALLKFETPGITGVVLEAKLYVHVADAALDELMVESIDSDWDASTVRFSTKPHRANVPLDAVSMLTPNTWYALDVTLAFKEIVGEHSFLLSTSFDYEFSEVHSKESTYAPYLVVESVVVDPQPTGVCATPPMAPPPSPDWEAHYAYDGCSTLGDAHDGQYFPVESTKTLAVACCRQDGNCYTKTDDDICYEAADWAGAKALCESLDLQLCTAEHLYSGACCDRGCGINSELTWTQQNMKEMYQPPAPPAEFCKTALEYENAKCYDYTVQEKYGTQEEVMQEADRGGFEGFAYSSEKGKGQLFSSEECVGVNGGSLQYNWYIYSKYGCAEVESEVSLDVGIDGDVNSISDGDTRRALSVVNDTGDGDYDYDDEDEPQKLDTFLQAVARVLAEAAGTDMQSVKMYNLTESTKDNSPKLLMSMGLQFVNGNGSKAYAFRNRLESEGVSLFPMGLLQTYAISHMDFMQLKDYRTPPSANQSISTGGPPGQDQEHDHDHDDTTIVALLCTILVVLILFVIGSFGLCYWLISNAKQIGGHPYRETNVERLSPEKPGTADIATVAL